MVVFVLFFEIFCVFFIRFKLSVVIKCVVNLIGLWSSERFLKSDGVNLLFFLRRVLIIFVVNVVFLDFSVAMLLSSVVVMRVLVFLGVLLCVVELFNVLCSVVIVSYFLFVEVFFMFCIVVVIKFFGVLGFFFVGVILVVVGVGAEVLDVFLVLF